MTYTFISAVYANPEHSAAVAITGEAGAVALSAADTPAEWALLLGSGVAIAPFDDMPTIGEQISAADADFERKKAALSARLLTIELADGAVSVAKKAAIQAEFATLAAEHDAAIDAILFGE